MKKKSTLLDFLLKYQQLLYIFIILFVLTGVIALFVMPRDEYPQFRITQGLVVGIYPGASSAQVEEQLTAKVENYLFQYKTVDRAKTYSISKENLMVIYVTVHESEKNPDTFWLKLRHGLNELKKDLPEGVLSLTADNDFGDTSILLLAVQSETKSYKELENDYVKKFENDLRKIGSISKIKHYGLQKEQISIYIDDSKLANYAIKPIQFFTVLKPQSSVNYAGEINDGKLVRPIHVQSGYKTEEEISNQIIYADPAGNVIRVKDVAHVKREYGDPDSYIRVNGKKCIVISLEMKKGSNVVRLGKDVDKEIKRFSESLPPDVKVITVSDVPHAVSKSISTFLKEFLIAIISVILVTALLLPGRIARIAAISVPTSIFIALAMMWAVGIDLQTVSLAGLIIVLGICVDDAMVIIDNYIEKLDDGMSPYEAGNRSVEELFSSVLSATLIIISCFMPLPFFLNGPAADFSGSFPPTITFALLVSLVISVTLIPLLNFHMIKTGIKTNKTVNDKKTFLDKTQNFYDDLIEKVFRRKKLIVLIGALSFLTGLTILFFTPRQTFPKIERNQFAVEVYLPEGSSLQQTDAVIADIENVLKKDRRVKVVTSFIGTGSPRFHAVYAPNLPSKNYGQLVVLTESNEETFDILDEYSRKFKGHYPLANIKWKQLSLGPARYPIEIRISGDDIPVIKETANRVSDIVRSAKGTEFIHTDFGEPLQVVDVEVRRDEASRLGFSNPMIGYSLLTGTKGFPVSTVWEGDYPVDVKLLVDKKTKSTADEIRNNYLTTPFSNVSIPVRQLAEIKAGWTEGAIVRRNGVRTITVRSELERGLIPSVVFSKIRPQVEKLKLPEGVSIAFGGDYQDSVENLTPLSYSLILSIMLIFLILMFQYRSIRTSLIIMVTLPLSIFGAAFGVFIMGFPFSLTAFIGLIGLMGIVVRNGVIFISYANELVSEHGYSVEQAAISAGKRRMRPIFLTSAAAIAGVLPMTVGRSHLWGPLGAVISFGLLFALILTLLVMPVIYYYFQTNDKILAEKAIDELTETDLSNATESKSSNKNEVKGKKRKR